MKFLTTITTALYALALGTSAVPVNNESRDLVQLESRSLVPRAITETDAYKKAKAAHSDIAPGTRYVFTIKFAKHAESNPKMKEFTDKLGFSHIGLVVGEVVQSPNTGSKSRPTYTLDFTANIFDLTWDQKETSKVETDKMAWRTSSATLTYVKTTTKTDAQISAKGATWNNKNYEYTVGGTNCDGYVTMLKAFV